MKTNSVVQTMMPNGLKKCIHICSPSSLPLFFLYFHGESLYVSLLGFYLFSFGSDRGHKCSYYKFFNHC